MINIENLRSYVPAKHGEHGVDATLHMLAHTQSIFFEVFSNPPGGSWAIFDILKPGANEIFRWDHIPRVPNEAKRPDFVLQYNDNADISFLMLESKPSIRDLYDNMGSLLKNFFLGSTGYLGLKKRPAWHKKRMDSENWSVIPPESSEERYWFKNYPLLKIHMWAGFAIALEPEFVEDLGLINLEKIREILETVLRTQKDLDFIIAIGWQNLYHQPFVIRAYSQKFITDGPAVQFDRVLSPIV